MSEDLTHATHREDALEREDAIDARTTRHRTHLPYSNGRDAAPQYTLYSTGHPTPSTSTRYRTAVPKFSFFCAVLDRSVGETPLHAGPVDKSMNTR